MEEDSSDKMDVKGGGKYLGVSQFTVRTWIQQKRLPYFRCGRRIILSRRDLDAFLAKCKVAQT